MTTTDCFIVPPPVVGLVSVTGVARGAGFGVPRAGIPA
jgi:hypothetical protein